MLKTFFTIVCTLLLLGFKSPAGAGAFDPSTIQKWVVTPSSFMNIEGKSNINSFSCSVTEFLSTDTLSYLFNDKMQKQGQFKGQLVVDVKKFDCHQRFITSDLRRTLKADENPTMSIRFLTLDKLGKEMENHAITGLVEIELAGMIKRYQVNYTIQTNNSQLILTGNKTVMFSDFHLKAPSRIAGLIKIEEEIQVHFQLNLKPIKTSNSI